MAPKSPRKIHWRPEAPRDSLSHRELWSVGDGHATKAKGALPRVEGTPRCPRSRWQRRLGRREAGVRPATSALLHPLLLWVAWAGPGIRRNGGQVWAVPWSPCHPPQPPPSLGQGSNSWALAPTLYTKHTKRRIVTTISINKVGQIQPWRKREPSCWLQGRGVRATPRLDLGLKSARTARSTRPSLQQIASLHKHQRLANPLRQCTARKRFRKALSLIEKVA